eukprot:TRINITY_DN1432_c0_g1_i2.p1 TRINITY_DN1432_c0_g1~~TRINITY_DN1432_c0_g1_i2.p1  ORF type:complete len:277 (-),score=66.22 TRINITY_DN1432_c0_g1_i2:97-927(-)
MSTDRATGGDELDAKPVYCDENGGGDSKRMNVDDYHADMLDKLRSDDFKGLVQSANDAHDKQNEQMCLGSDGSITKANPYTAYAHRSTVGTGTHDSLKPQPVSEDDELKKLRAQRMAQMQQEQSWRQQGHGKLRELQNEADFIGVVKPRERAVVLLSDSTADKETPEVADALVSIAKKHVEAQFCHLELEKAGILSAILNLDDGLPVVLVLKHGQVTRSFPPESLFEYSSASSPMFPKHLASMLRRAGGIGSGVQDANSDSGCESEEEELRRRRKR